MRFKQPGGLIEFASVLHPDVRMLLIRFDSWAVDEGIGQLTITDVSRRSSPKFSWHDHDCAADVRNKLLNSLQRFRAEKWLEGECHDREKWELITKDHGTGPHFHIARRDHSRIKPNGHAELEEFIEREAVTRLDIRVLKDDDDPTPTT